MENKVYYPIPTKEQMRNRRNIEILESNDEELYKLYDEAIQGAWHFKHDKELLSDFKKDKELIEIEFRNRGLRIPLSGKLNIFSVTTFFLFIVMLGIYLIIKML